MKNHYATRGLLLLAVVMTVSSVTGCGCCRRFRDRLSRGALCGAPAAAVAAPTYAAPTPVMQPQVIQPPVIQPQYVQPQVMQPQPVCVPCQPVCQPTCVPCDPCCDPCGSSYGYGGEYSMQGPIYGGESYGGWAPADCAGCTQGGVSTPMSGPMDAPMPAESSPSGGMPNDPGPLPAQ